MATTSSEDQLSNDDPEINHTNSTFEVVEKHDVETDHPINTQINESNLTSIAPNALFKSFPKEYIETLISRLNERSNDDMNNIENTDNSLNMDKLKNIGGTLAQQIPTLLNEFKRKSQNIEENKQSNDSDDDDDDYEYQYYHTKINHDIEWNTASNDVKDELFVISKELFEDQDINTFINETKRPNTSQSHTKIRRKKKNSKNNIQITHKNNDNNNIDNKNKYGLSQWTESLNSMLIHAKHRMYTMLANPSFKWDSRQNRHLFSLSHNVWIMGNEYIFNNNNKHIMQCIVLDIYSKIWITYRSKFENILSSHYRSDAGWGCMLRTTQMMTAQALIIYHFDTYKWNVTMLDDRYYRILSLFNDTMDSALSIHNMIKHGSVLYNKPVGHWYGPMQTAIMIKKCIDDYSKLSDDIECIVCDSATIYKSEIEVIIDNYNKYILIFLPLRLGLDSLNINYIESIKECFHLTECIGIIGGKPQKSLYFIGYQDNNLFYLDPHTVFPTPNINKALSLQRCIFHCKEINSVPAQQLDPSMAIAFFIKPKQIHLNTFWQNATKLSNHKYSIFSLSQNRPKWRLDEFDDHQIHSDSNLDNEWEKI